MCRRREATYNLVFGVLLASSQRHTGDTKPRIAISISNVVNEFLILKHLFECLCSIPMSGDGGSYCSLECFRCWREDTFCVATLARIERPSSAEQERFGWFKEYSHQSCPFRAR